MHYANEQIHTRARANVIIIMHEDMCFDDI